MESWLSVSDHMVISFWDTAIWVWLSISGSQVYLAVNLISFSCHNIKICEIDQTWIFEKQINVPFINRYVFLPSYAQLYTLWTFDLEILTLLFVSLDDSIGKTTCTQIWFNTQISSWFRKVSSLFYITVSPLNKNLSIVPTGKVGYW